MAGGTGSDQLWEALNTHKICKVRKELVEKQPNKNERLKMILDYLTNSDRSYNSPLQNCYIMFIIMRSLEEKDRLTLLLTTVSSADIIVFEKISGPLVFDILCPFYGRYGLSCGTSWCADMLRLIRAFVRDVISWKSVIKCTPLSSHTLTMNRIKKASLNVLKSS